MESRMNRRKEPNRQPFRIVFNRGTREWEIRRFEDKAMVDSDGRPASGELFGSFASEQEAEKYLQTIIRDLRGETD